MSHLCTLLNLACLRKFGAEGRKSAVHTEGKVIQETGIGGLLRTECCLPPREILLCRTPCPPQKLREHLHIPPPDSSFRDNVTTRHISLASLASRSEPGRTQVICKYRRAKWRSSRARCTLDRNPPALCRAVDGIQDSSTLPALGAG